MNIQALPRYCWRRGNLPPSCSWLWSRPADDFLPCLAGRGESMLLLGDE